MYMLYKYHTLHKKQHPDFYFNVIVILVVVIYYFPPGFYDFRVYNFTAMAQNDSQEFAELWEKNLM